MSKQASLATDNGWAKKSAPIAEAVGMGYVVGALRDGAMGEFGRPMTATARQFKACAL